VARRLLELLELGRERLGLGGREERGAIDDATGELGDLEGARNARGRERERDPRGDGEEPARDQRSTSGATWALSVVALKVGRSDFPRSEAPIMLGKRSTTLLYSDTFSM
jgi:hypothetical protein